MDSFGKAEKVYSVTKQMTEKSQKIYEEKVSQMEEEYESEIKDINNKRRENDEETKKLINDLTIKLEVLKAENKALEANEQLYNNQK